MALIYYISSLGLVPYFTCRAFIPLFTSAALARLGPAWPMLAEASGFEVIGSLPPFLTSNTALCVLAVMAGVEFVGTKSPEAREILRLFDTKLKAVAAFFICFAMVGGNPFELIELFRRVGFSTDFAWGQSFAYTWSFAIGVVVWLAAALRNAVYGFLIEVDENDDLGLQSLLAWLEDIVSFLGVWLVIIAPVLALGMVALTLLGLYLLRRYLEYREEKTKVPCEHCGNPNSPCGLTCAACGAGRRLAQKVGVLGNVKGVLVTDPGAHQIELLARKRCSSCGERLMEKRVDQSCQGCGKPAFGNHVVFDQYLERLRARLPRTLAILFALSCIPLFGLIPGVIYYRLSLISSLRRYLPRSVGFFTRWVVRVVNICLLCLQPVPILGAVTLPLMCLTNYAVYQAALRRQGRLAFVGELQPA